MRALEAHLQRQLSSSREFFWHRLRTHAVSRFFPENQPLSVLDVGAGAGLLGEFIDARFPRARYHFIEPIESLETKLVARFGAQCNQSGAPNFRNFDRVVLLDVLEHQSDDRAFARQIVEKMKPGTILILTVPALRALWSRWDVALGHYRRYVKSSLRHVFEGLPVEWIEVSYLFPEMVPLGLIRKWTAAQCAGAENEAEFPELSRPVNLALYAIARVSFALRGLVPFGTSLFAALRIL
jgi:SAM-dependent methyltransferase